MTGNKTGTCDPPLWKIFLDLTNMAEVKIEHFVANKIKNLFQILDEPLQFFNKDPSIWKGNDNFHVVRKKYT